MNTATNFIKRVLDNSNEEFHRNNIRKIRNILRKNDFPFNTIDNLIKSVTDYKKKPTNVDDTHEC